ncbi:site-2 protease family protein [Candidatus Curtissbacteria bacterium]|nr:site-2 protease family protein [Candidatus Curtissbacteria bacterium]MBI2599160.1 site-2 protease family protein [Candidatus Curtissbacteria bacterium]
MFKIPIFQILLFIILLNFVITRQLPFLLSAVFTNPLVGISMIIGLIAGITIHEFSHAYVAYRLGDPTAKLEGRMTLNPLAHLDPVGTAALLFIGIGWGKPTPFDPFNLRNIKRDSALISVAGAASNLALALVISIPYLLAYYLQMLNPTLNMVYLYLSPIIFFNIILAVFNLIPVAPLDGFKVLGGLLPREWYRDFMQTEKYGIFILLLLLVTGAVGQILFPITSTVFSLLIPGLRAPF